MLIVLQKQLVIIISKIESTFVLQAMAGMLQMRMQFTV